MLFHISFYLISLIWYYKLTQLLTKDLDFILKEDKDTISNLLLNDNNGDNFSKKSFQENMQDLDKIKIFITDFINKSSRIDILCCNADWLKVPCCVTRYS